MTPTHRIAVIPGPTPTGKRNHYFLVPVDVGDAEIGRRINDWSVRDEGWMLLASNDDDADQLRNDAAVAARRLGVAAFFGPDGQVVHAG